MEIFPVEILLVSNPTTSKFSFVTPPKARSDIPPSLTHLQYMPSIQSYHLSNLAIYLVLPSIVLLSIWSCHLFSLSIYLYLLFVPSDFGLSIASAIYAFKVDTTNSSYSPILRPRRPLPMVSSELYDLN